MQTVFRPVAMAAATHARLQLRAFLAAHRRTAQTQDQLLLRLVRSAENTAFGRDHGLRSVRTYRDFTAAVPVGDYETHRPYVDRLLKGEVEALYPPGTELVMFAVTSGTTGAPKHIPVTRQYLADCRRGWSMFGVRVMDDHRACWLRRILTITSSAHESTSPSGVPCGAITGMLARTQRWIVRQMYPVPLAACEIRDGAAKFYTILRCALAQDVGLLTTANPSSAVKLGETALAHTERLIRDVRDGALTPPGEIPASVAPAFGFRPDAAAARRLEEIIRRHGQLLPRHFWNLGALTLWTGGTLGLYLPRVRQLFGDVPIRDIGLLASEGRFSVPLEDGTPAGVAEITSSFLEFLPVEQAGSGSPDLLRAHEVQVGREYFLVLTNHAALWRYNLDDRVRVTGKLGQSPVFEFLSRGLHTTSLTGEKLTEHQVVQAMRQATARLGSGPSTFTLQGHFADPPYYQLLLEPADGVDVGHVGAELDAALGRLNVEYEGKRASGRLGPVRAACVPVGHFAAEETRQLALRRGRAEQYKHKYLLTEIVQDG